MEPGMLNFVEIGLRVSATKYMILPCLLMWLVLTFVFGVLQQEYTRERIFTQNTSNDVIPGKEVPFGGPNDYILYLDP